MDAIGWRSGHSLARLLEVRYAHFNVYQLVRLWLRKAGVLSLNTRDIGRHVRFAAELSSTFSGSEVTRLKRGSVSQTAPIHLYGVNFTLAGNLGPLPEPFTDWVRERERVGDRAFASFLDLFNHRLGVLRYQLKARSHLGLNNAPPAETPHAARMSALMGMADPRLADQLPMPRRAWLGLAGLLANCRRSAPAISRVLSLYLATPVSLTPLIGAWRPIEPVDHNRLGLSNARLGQELVLGRRMWDAKKRIRLHIGPLPYVAFCQLLPGEKNHPAFASLVRYLTDRQVDVEVALKMDPSTLPKAHLSPVPISVEAPAQAPVEGQPSYFGLRLSQTAWLNTKPLPQTTQTEATYVIAAFDLAGAA